MKQQILVFKTALDSLESYAGQLSRAAELLRTGSVLPELHASFLSVTPGAGVGSRIEALTSAATSALRMRATIRDQLGAAQVVAAQVRFLGAARILDGILEGTLDMGNADPASVVLPAFRYFKPVYEAVYLAFPYTPGDPAEGPVERAFRNYLLTDHNPWAL